MMSLRDLIAGKMEAAKQAEFFYKSLQNLVPDMQ